MTWTCCATARCLRCSAGPGAVHAGVVPAVVHLGQRAAAGARCTGSSWPGWPAAAPLLPGADVLAFVDVDSQQKRVYGHAKQGAAFGHHQDPGQGPAGPRPERAGRHDLHAAGRPGDRRHQAARRQRRLARGAASMITEAVATARPPGAPARWSCGWTRRSTAPRPCRPPAAPGRISPSPSAWTPGPRRDRRHRRGRLDPDPLSPRRLR